VTVVGAFNIAVDLLGMDDSLEGLAQRLSHFLLTLFTGKAEKEFLGDNSSSSKNASQERKEKC
ncbi:MAG TPA: hypothetical protein VGU68_03275, partial [Ktedonobacteraceae bacterium]|nr:hypothetical protein [Ktedonobacteraceae bacterium]